MRNILYDLNIKQVCENIFLTSIIFVPHIKTFGSVTVANQSNFHA